MSRTSSHDSLDNTEHSINSAQERAASPRILIVDDEAAQMQALCETLRQHGYDTVGCVSAESALTRLLASKFDLLLSDLMMPGMDGIALLEAALQVDPDLTGIIMTGQGTIDSAVGAMKGGTFDYILKPFRLSTILPVIARALDMRRMRMQNAQLARSVHERTIELEEANRELDAFTRSISHDLRTPVRGICEYSKLVLQQSASVLSELDQGYLRYIAESAEGIGRLIEGLLHLSQSARAPISKGLVRVASLVHQIINEHRSECASRSVQFHVGELPDCMADETLLRQVFVNLLSNAIKYTRLKDEAIINIGSQRQDQQTTYFVKDNGAGFDMQHADNLFGIFQRLHSAKDFEGTGVGLSTVQRIIQRHGGRVWAQASVGEGATFFFTLPCDACCDPLALRPRHSS